MKNLFAAVSMLAFIVPATAGTFTPEVITQAENVILAEFVRMKQPLDDVHLYRRDDQHLFGLAHATRDGRKHTLECEATMSDTTLNFSVGCKPIN